MHRLMLIGNPVAHSKSPEIHQLFGAQVGIPVVYEKVAVEDDEVASAVTAFFASGGLGMNVTVPHKERVFSLVDQLTPEAAGACAVNTLWMDGDALVGHNTDGLGLVDDLHRLGLAVTGRRVLVLGAGGAIAGCLGPLLACKPAELILANRTLDRATALAARFPGVKVCHLDDVQALSGAIDGVISGLSSGLSGEWSIELPMAQMTPETWCYDLVYAPLVTPFLRACSGRTARCHDGFGMLVGQAARSFNAWLSCHVDPWAVYQQLRPLGSAG